VEQERVLIEENWYAIGHLYLVINELVSGPLGFARAVPEINRVSPVPV